MKQYLSSEQTAKLIELGFEKPKNRLVKQRFDRSTSSWIVIGEEGGYSIGELMEMLGYDLYSMHYLGMSWEVKGEQLAVIKEELIDALYDMILRLKEKELI